MGGVETVTLGDDEARRRRTQKTVQERRAPPTFDILVEIQGWNQVAVHSDVAEMVDRMLRGSPLTPETRHLIRGETLPLLKKGVMLVNTSRGAIIDTQAAIAGLKDGTIGSLGIDVYEEEADLFFEDLSNEVLRDDVFARLLTFPNVLVTGHQGFFTQEALKNIADTTIGNIESFFRTGRALHAVSTEQFAGPA